MHGKIRVQSEEGNGTMFTLELPFDHVSKESNVGMGILPDAKAFSTADVGSSITATASANDSNNQLHIASLSGFQRTLAATIDSSMKFPTNRSLRLRDDTEGMSRPALPQRLQYVDEGGSLVRPGSLNGSTTSRSERSPTAASTIETSACMELDEKKQEHYNVLIAEDNPVNAKVLRRRLEKFGHTVTHAVDGQTCHDLFNSNEKYDVILMDIQVRSNGLDFIVVELTIIRCHSLMVRNVRV